MLANQEWNELFLVNSISSLFKIRYSYSFRILALCSFLTVKEKILLRLTYTKLLMKISPFTVDGGGRFLSIVHKLSSSWSWWASKLLFQSTRASNGMEGVDTHNRTIFIIIGVRTSNLSTEKSQQ